MHKSELKQFERPTVLVAHPDDEVISCSQPLHYLRDRVHVVYATDGDASDSGISEVVQGEAKEAMKALGVRNLNFLDIPEFELYEYLGLLRKRLENTLGEIQPDLLITHCYEGGHFDHDLLRLIVELMRRDGILTGEMMEFALYHDRGGHHNHNTFIVEFPGLEILFHPEEEDIERKKSAFAAYRSQALCLQDFETDNVERVRRSLGKGLKRFVEKPHEWDLGYDEAGEKNSERFNQIANQLINEN